MADAGESKDRSELWQSRFDSVEAREWKGYEGTIDGFVEVVRAGPAFGGRTAYFARVPEAFLRSDPVTADELAAIQKALTRTFKREFRKVYATRVERWATAAADALVEQSGSSDGKADHG